MSTFLFLYVVIYGNLCYNFSEMILLRVSITKSKNSEQLYILHSFRKNGKSSSRVIKKLGSMADLLPLHNNDRDQVLAWANQQAALLTQQYQDQNESLSFSLSPSLRIPRDQLRSFNCGSLFLQSLDVQLHFDSLCRSIRSRHQYQFDLNAILSHLIFSRVLYPSSKASSFSFAQSLLDPPSYELHDVYRALSILAQESDFIQKETYRNSQFLHPRNTKVLYYDCTNYYFEIEQEEASKKYGKSKENRPNPIIGMGLFMDGDGFPLAFNLYPGNQNEQLSLLPLEKKVVRDFECSEFIYCSDSGLGSAKNKAFNALGGRSYVVTQSLKKLKEEDRKIALDPTQYRKLNSEKFIDLRTLDEEDPDVFNAIYYKEIPLDSKSLSETLIVTYSPKYKAYQAKIRQGQIDRAMKMITQGGKLKKNRKNPHDPARFIQKTAVTDQGEVADQWFCQLNQEVMDQEAMYDGFYGVVTNLEVEVSEIIAINQQRWQIEECFRMMKTDFSARPVYLQREDRIQAHFLICFLALLFYRLLEKKLDKQYTIDQILSTLRGMQVCSLEGLGYIPTYQRTALTDKLHQLFGFYTDTQIIKPSQMRSILRQVKTRP